MDNLFHLTVKVKSRRNINATTIISTLNDFLEFLQFSKEELSLPGELSEVNFKVNLNSPGAIEFISSTPFIAMIAILVIGTCGGRLEINTLKGFSLKLGTQKPLLQLINEFLNDSTRRKFVNSIQKKFEELEIGNPEVVEKMLRSIAPSPPSIQLPEAEKSQGEGNEK